MMGSALYWPSPPPFAAVIGVSIPFFVLVSTMGVLISLVAIPLRGRMPRLAIRTGSGYALKTDSGKLRKPSSGLRRRIDFKLLKCLILRFVWRLSKLYHGSASFSTLAKPRIDRVNVPF